MAKFLDLTGVEYLWSKITTKLGDYVTKDGDKVLSDNNFTDDLLSKLNGIEENANNYKLPAATTEALGGVKVGNGLGVTGDGTLSAKIVSIKLNGSPVEPEDGVIDLGSIATSGSIDALSGRVDTVEAALENKVDTSAIVQSSGQSTESIMSQKAVTDYINDQISSGSAHYLTKDAEGNVFATKAELTGADTFYYGGDAHEPHEHDYVFVQKDESNDNYATRYVYTGGQWVLQYKVNEAPLTTEQTNAINSGITAAKVSTYDGYAAQIAAKLDASKIVQVTGQATDSVMSQKAVTDALDGKAAKATTISGYGITDAKIENAVVSDGSSNKVITLGSDTVTVLSTDDAITNLELDEILV